MYIVTNKLTNFVAVLSPPHVTDTVFRVTFGELAVTQCNDDNNQFLDTELFWEDTDGNLVSLFRILRFLNVTNSDAGEYRCVARSLVTGERSFTPITVIVQCK